MKRNSTTLFLASPGATTPIPWVNDAPDFLGFTEPTLSVLKSAWQEFLDSGEELEIIPDPHEPDPPVPRPQWQSFNGAILSDSGFQSAIAVNPIMGNALLIALNNVMLNLIDVPGFAFYCEGFVQSVGITAEQRQEWAAIASACNLPADIVAVIGGNNG